MRSKHSKAKTESGISNQLPKILPYPPLIPFESAASIHNIYSYVITHYGTNGISVLVYRQPDQDAVTVICGDWCGNKLDIQDGEHEYSEIANKFVAKDLTNFINLMYSMRLTQAQYFFAVVNDELMLVDVQISLNKLVGPGMVNDIFGKIFLTQEVKKIEILDERAVEYINKGTGSYSGDLILKPSKFRMYHDPEQNTYTPLYVEMRR